MALLLLRCAGYRPRHLYSTRRMCHSWHTVQWFHCRREGSGNAWRQLYAHHPDAVYTHSFYKQHVSHVMRSQQREHLGGTELASIASSMPADWLDTLGRGVLSVGVINMNTAMGSASDKYLCHLLGGDPQSQVFRRQWGQGGRPENGGRWALAKERKLTLLSQGWMPRCLQGWEPSVAVPLGVASGCEAQRLLPDSDNDDV